MKMHLLQWVFSFDHNPCICSNHEKFKSRNLQRLNSSNPKNQASFQESCEGQSSDSYTGHRKNVLNVGLFFCLSKDKWK